jgi:magnesium-transporting ATPase (P-type)
MEFSEHDINQIANRRTNQRYFRWIVAFGIYFAITFIAFYIMSPMSFQYSIHTTYQVLCFAFLVPAFIACVLWTRAWDREKVLIKSEVAATPNIMICQLIGPELGANEFRILKPILKILVVGYIQFKRAYPRRVKVARAMLDKTTVI